MIQYSENYTLSKSALATNFAGQATIIRAGCIRRMEVTIEQTSRAETGSESLSHNKQYDAF